MVSRIAPQAIRKLYIQDNPETKLTRNHRRVICPQRIVDFLCVTCRNFILIPSTIQPHVDPVFAGRNMLWDNNGDDLIDDNIYYPPMPVLPCPMPLALRQIVVVNENVHNTCLVAQP